MSGRRSTRYTSSAPPPHQRRVETARRPAHVPTPTHPRWDPRSAGCGSQCESRAENRRRRAGRQCQTQFARLAPERARVKRKKKKKRKRETGGSQFAVCKKTAVPRWVGQMVAAPRERGDDGSWRRRVVHESSGMGGRRGDKSREEARKEQGPSGQTRGEEGRCRAERVHPGRVFFLLRVACACQRHVRGVAQRNDGAVRE